MPRRRMAEDAQEIYEKLGDAIRRARTKAGRTQGSVAAAADVKDQTTFSDYERGRSRITLDVLARIEDALGLERGQLLVDAGLVDRAQIPVNTPAEQAIEDDGSLDRAAKDLVLYTYRYCIGLAEQAREPTAAELRDRLNRVTEPAATPRDRPA